MRRAGYAGADRKALTVRAPNRCRMISVPMPRPQPISSTRWPSVRPPRRCSSALSYQRWMAQRTTLALAIATSAAAQDGGETITPHFERAIPNIPGKSLAALVVDYAEQVRKREAAIIGERERCLVVRPH
jgi:hypothetical protein